MADLDESIVKDFAEKILKSFESKPQGSRFGRPSIVEFVRDSHTTEEEIDRYRNMSNSILEYVHSATSLLIEQKKIQEHKGSGDWDNKYSLI